MTSVWKRLQRVNKRAAKFQFTASYHRIDLETTLKWKPNKLSVVWSRRSRRVVAEPLDWEPSMKEPLKGSVIWAVPDNHNIAVTLYRDQRTNELEDKDWTFILEDVASNGRRRVVAQAPVNLCPLASAGSMQESMRLQMRPCTAKVVSASLEVTISSVLLREGSAADEDMQSMASIMSMNNNSDIAPLEDFEEDDYSQSENSTNIKQMLDLTQQMELMTSSLTGTPGSEASLTTTPTAAAPYDPFDNQKKYSYKIPSLPFDEDKHAPPLFETTKNTEMSKRNLKPLDLKTNHNNFQYKESEESNSNLNTPVTDSDNNDKTPVPEVVKIDKTKLSRDSGEENMGRDVTPAQDLLEWCKEATKAYPQCNIVNLSTSWSDGIGFCAIINNFKPDLIDMVDVLPDNAESNVRMALKASDVLGVPGVFHPSEICRARGPDRLAVITYLHQLRALFTNRQYRLSKIGPTSEESSYIIGHFNTDRHSDVSANLFSQEILTMRQKKAEGHPVGNRASLSSQDSIDSQHSQDRNAGRLSSPDRILNTEQKEKSPISGMKDVKGMFLASKNILGRVLSPTKEKLQNFKSSFDNRSTAKDLNENTNSNIINKEKLLKESKNETIAASDSAKSDKNVMGIREMRPIKLMTRKQLTDPFGSDEEDEDQDVLTVRVDDGNREGSSDKTASDEAKSDAASPGELLPKPTQQLLSRHDELKEKARQLLEAAKKEAREKEQKTEPEETQIKVKNTPTSPQKLNEEARQAQLRERARKLIADARAGHITSPTTPSGRGGIVEVLSPSQVLAEQQLSNIDYHKSNRSKSPESSPEKVVKKIDAENNILNNEDKKSIDSPTRQFNLGVNKSSSPLRSYQNIIDRISPDKESFILKGFGKDMRDHIQGEMEALEREQMAIDQQAAILEKELRSVMESGQSEEMENALMIKWFTLVNKKNALLKRQMHLNILEQEMELRARHAKVDEELRALLTVEEWRKSEGQRGDEARLIRELLSVVDARDQLLHNLHEHEQAIEDDDEIEKNLSTVELKKKNNCFIQ